jgi:PAS fold.
MYGLIQNFHEEKTRNEELKKSELRLDDILENVSNTIVIWDGDKKLSKINSAGRDIWKKVFGVEDRVGMDFKEFSLQAMKKGFFQIPENEDINEWADKEFDHQFNRVEQQFEIEGDDGSWYRGQRSRLKDGGYISIGSDITELKKHEKELEEQKELYSFLIDSINGVVFDWDLKTQKVDYSINPNHESIASQFLNFSNEQEVFEILDPQDHQRFRETLIQHFKKENELFEFETRILNENRDMEWNRIRGKARWNDEGRAVRMIGLIENIDKERKIREKLNSAEKILVDAINNVPVGLQIWDTKK